MDQKYKEKDLKFEETNQQKVFKKKQKWIKNQTKQTYKHEENDQKKGIHLTLNIEKEKQNIWKSINNSELLRDFLEFLKKNRNSSKIIFDLFPCCDVSMSLRTWGI